MKVFEEGREVETGKKCKIDRTVAFQETIDMHEFCTEDLQKKLQVNRKIASEKSEKTDTPAAAPMEVDEGAEDVDPDLQAALAMSMGSAEEPENCGEGLPPAFAGYRCRVEGIRARVVCASRASIFRPSVRDVRRGGA